MKRVDWNGLLRTIVYSVIVIGVIALLQVYVPMNCVKEPTINYVGIRTGLIDTTLSGENCALRDDKYVYCNTTVVAKLKNNRAYSIMKYDYARELLNATAWRDK